MPGWFSAKAIFGNVKQMRGYSMALSTDGHLITQVADLTSGDSMQVRFRDGTAKTTVKSVISQ
ncbi:MAG: hypothetical protein Q9M82_03970 [Mariprofundus sp.]|nr:hypothetical protein [Mariprofundus sp.]